MNTSLKWIKALVPGIKNIEEQEYTDRMTLSGTKVECFEKKDKNLEKIIVGKIISVEKHPDADKLVVCQVNVGENTVQIVTGAPNIRDNAIGRLVPVVLDGGKVACMHGNDETFENGTKIKKGKLRGVESFGMMCGLEELGADSNLYDSSDDGVYIFPENQGIKEGDNAVEALGLNDSIFEYEITNNRVDCYSVLGIAREVAATFDTEFIPPSVKETGNSEDINNYLSVEVKATDLCSRYMARVVKNIKIEPSPEWMKERLRASGIRPINNIVDITNYVMEEFGQPMHAFDYDLIEDNKIVVQRAKDGEQFTTLDGAERTLDSDILMICDGKKEIGIAGIMGGENSKISDDVKTLVFESAIFNGTNIRKSAKRLSLRTDASGKFEKGIDPENAKLAMDRACDLIEELGAGEVIGGAIDIYPNPVAKKRVAFNPDVYNKLLGTDISPEEMIGIFNKIEIEYDQNSNELIIPTFRQDLLYDADMAEEVARFFGYDKIPTTLPKGSGNPSVIGGISFDEQIKVCSMDVCESLGYSQSLTYSFESPKVFNKLKLSEDAPERKTVKISNPLGEDFSIMRTLSVNGMLTSLATNYKRRNSSVRLYEIAKVYIPNEDENLLPNEKVALTFGFYDDGDFFDLKGDIEVLFDKLGIKGNLEYEKATDIPFLHPGRSAKILYADENVGWLGEVHPEVAQDYAVEGRTYLGVVYLDDIEKYVSFEEKYTGIANFPAVTRDISLTMPKDVAVREVEKVIENCGGKLVEDYYLFDIYEGSQLGSNKKSVAYSISFRASDRTLTDDDVNPVMEKIITDLDEKGFKLRS